jgi:hypothetical protein
MVCAVCSVDRRDDGREHVVLDYPRYMSAPKPCPNCGSGSEPPLGMTPGEYLTAMADARRKSRSVVLKTVSMSD